MNNKDIFKVKDVSVLLLCSLIAFAGLGWMTAVWLLGKISSSSDTISYLSSLSWEILKIVFISSSVGIIVNLFIVRRIVCGEADKIFTECGIDEIKPSRVSAISQFKKIVQDKKNKNIYLGGISLRDFLTQQGPMHIEVWEIIVERLEEEEMKKIPDDKRLRVRCLLLDPRSPEGNFRYQVELNAIGGQGLKEDVPTGMKTVKNTIQRIYGKDTSKFLEARLYDHCPFSFMFGTENEIFVEQYYYRDHMKMGCTPLVRYKGGTLQYKHFTNSYRTIWQSTDTIDYIPYHLGVAKAIWESNIKNIYRSGEKDLLSKREIECITNSSDNRVSLLAVTGKHFVINRDYNSLLKNISVSSDKEKTHCNVRVAIVNPVSQQAIIRAVSDGAAFTDIGSTLKGWNWDEHRKSKLYQNVQDTRREIEKWIKKGKSIDLKLYTSSIACSLVITGNSIFVEQYSLGRSLRFLDGRVLGGEYPVFELIRSTPPTKEEEILTSHFDVIWEYFCISYNDYSKINEENHFNQNLAYLLNGCISSSISNEECH